MADSILRSPYPYFDAKRMIMPDVWVRLGGVRNFIDPFIGSGASLWGRPEPFEGVETVNDLDGFIPNLLRAIQGDPDMVARYADWPVIEADLHARHQWLVNHRSMVEKLIDDPEWFDAKIAGWWVWGISCWLGSGWCKRPAESTGKMTRKKPILQHAAHGVHRRQKTSGTQRTKPVLERAARGIHRQNHGPDTQLITTDRTKPFLHGSGLGIHSDNGRSGRLGLAEYLNELSARLNNVRVLCGDWRRVLTPSVISDRGITAIFLDPPYAIEEYSKRLYAIDSDVSRDVRAWALEHGDDPMLRIALCGFDSEHDNAIPDTWERLRWKSSGSMRRSDEDGKREMHNAVR